MKTQFILIRQEGRRVIIPTKDIIRAYENKDGKTVVVVKDPVTGNPKTLGSETDFGHIAVQLRCINALYDWEGSPPEGAHTKIKKLDL